MSQKRRKRSALGLIEQDILQHLSGGDMLMSFLLSGRSTRAFYREAYKRARARYRDKRCLDGLEAKGLVSRRGEMLTLTQKGKELAAILESRAMHAAAPWKGNWWILMYDIPVSMSPFRFELRSLLIRGGFRKLQHSVWIHPHPSKELEVFLEHTPKLSRYVRYLETRPFAGLKTIADWKRLGTS